MSGNLLSVNLFYRGGERKEVSVLLSSESFHDGGVIPGEFAFAIPDPHKHITFSANRNPHLQWSGAPRNTQSFAVICHDGDVPVNHENVDREGIELASNEPRTEFFHWLLYDIPKSVTEVAAGRHSDGVVPHGKPGPEAPDGWRHGLNDYTGFNADKPEMIGDYYGYDGPCPPWNDGKIHRYVFTIYALNVAKLDILGRPTGAEVRRAIDGHGLAKARMVGTYSLNPRLIGLQ
jgi:Raf kinase inhibitor-like YbhB/YbcL family protein